MNRRGLFKMLGLGAAASALPSVAGAKPELPKASGPLVGEIRAHTYAVPAAHIHALTALSGCHTHNISWQPVAQTDYQAWNGAAWVPLDMYLAQKG